MAKTDLDEWFGFLGTATAATPEFIRFLDAQGVAILNPHTQKTYGDVTYHTFSGLAVAFGADGRLESVDFYRPAEGLVLPLGITLGDTGKLLVERFGEPVEKGGGMALKMDLWLRWEFFQVELDERTWEAGEKARWKALTIFK